MQLKERVEKYKKIVKGPRRGFLEKNINGTIVYCCPNGIGVYEGSTDIQCEKVVERGKYTVVQLKRENDSNH